MSTKGVQVVILCEDLQQECFIRHLFRLRGYQKHQLRPEKPRPGCGSGEQFVREQFPRELANCRRRRRSHPGTWLCLIVCMDADTQTVEDRVKSLRKACTDAGVPFRGEGEQVCFVVPKRNIETWLAYLRGEPVDEQAEYRKYACPSDCQRDVEHLDEMCRQQKLKPVPPPSLSHACEEFKRLQL
jgi:hypothetical protein